MVYLDTLTLGILVLSIVIRSIMWSEDSMCCAIDFKKKSCFF